MTSLNKLILGDNLEILRNLDSESVDLVYLDPPFFSNRNYEVIWGDRGEIRSFEDRWSGGIDHYIAWLKERVVEMHRLLKSTGSIFLHCDWHADAYIRVEILDKVFGENAFLSQIIWRRTFNSGSSKSIAKKFPLSTDTIFWYVKSKKYTFNKITRPLNENALKRYDKTDEKGRRFKWNPLKTVSKERLQTLLSSGEAKTSSTSKYPVYKHYLDESKGVLIDNLWEDIGQIHTQNKGERIGYPTQKPEKLLERIINCASNKGDLVLDPFVGGGTTVAVADRLKRNWIGIDQSVQAIKVSELRLSKEQLSLFQVPFTVQLHKYDYDTLRYKDAFEFEEWIIGQFKPDDQFEKGSSRANTKQRRDFGLDGKTSTGTPIQVKRSDNIGRNVVDNFLSAIQRYDKKLFEINKKEKRPVGYVIAFSFGKGAIQEVARLKNQEDLIIELIKVEEIVPIAKKPKLSVEIKDLSQTSPSKEAGGLKELEFVAQAESEAGIEFYSWDFAYQKEQFNPQIMLDKTGIQKYKFKVGEHQIAIKVIDNDGLESLEVIKLKINGGVKVGD